MQHALSSTHTARRTAACPRYPAMSLIYLLVVREWRRVFMEPSRVVGILMQPLLFLTVFGLGFSKSFVLSDGSNLSYVEYFFPGILGLVVLFSSIYSTLTLVDDKKCGFFRLVLISPGGVLGAVSGKVIATFSLGFTQSLLFLSLLVFLPISLSLANLFGVLVYLSLGSLCFSILGVLFAWLSPSSSAFHALMSVILIPMWLLSGAMFPLDNQVLAWLSKINPMSYLVHGLRNELNGVHVLAYLLVLLGFCLIFSWVLFITVRRPTYE